jgi:hypothetical protein
LSRHLKSKYIQIFTIKWIYSKSFNRIMWLYKQQPKEKVMLGKAKKKESRSGVSAFALLLVAAAVASTEAKLGAPTKEVAGAGCDVWNQTSGVANTIVPADVPFNPLLDTVFNSSNPANPIMSATIHFMAEGDSSPFIFLGCPAPFSAYSHGEEAYCFATNITADEFTGASKKLETALSDQVPVGSSAKGYAYYQASPSCPVTPFNDVNGTIFSVEKSAVEMRR